MVELTQHIPIYWTIIAGIWAYFLLELYICGRQRRTLFSTTTARLPSQLMGHMTLSTFEKHRLYANYRLKVFVVSKFYRMVVLTALFYYNGVYNGWLLTKNMTVRLDSYLPYEFAWINEILREINLCVLAILFITAMESPITLYSKLVVDKKRRWNQLDFSRIKVKMIFKLSIQLFTMFGILLKVEKAKHEEYFSWTMFLWQVVCIISMYFLSEQYYKYLTCKPTMEEPYISKAQALATRLNFPVDKLYVQRNFHYTAAVSGAIKPKIILDTDLIQRYETVENDSNDNQQQCCQYCIKNEEVEAILAHEIGHWKFNHVPKIFGISRTIMFIQFCLLMILHGYFPLYQAYGFPDESDMPVIAICFIIAGTLNNPIEYLMNIVLQQFEYQADAYATQIGYGNHLKTGLIKLSKISQSFPVLDSLYLAWYHTHPTLLQRMDAIDALITKSGAKEK